MTPLTKFFGCLLLLIAVSGTSCKKDDSGPGGCAANFNYGVELQAEATALTNAATAYANDQSTANCNAYKAAANAYIDAAEDVEDCVPNVDKAAFQQSIDAARANIAGITC